MCDTCDQQWCACAWGFLPACPRDSRVGVLLLVRLLPFWLGVLWALLTRHGTMVERGPPKKFHHCIPSGENPRAHTHIPLLTCITHHVCCDCLAPQYWEYYPNIRLHYIGHPVTVVTSGELQNRNRAVSKTETWQPYGALAYHLSMSIVAVQTLGSDIRLNLFLKMASSLTFLSNIISWAEASSGVPNH